MQPTTDHNPAKRLNHRPGRLAILLAAAALLLILAACSGSDADPAAARITDPVFGVDESGASFIGLDGCLACHEAQTPAAVASYLGSRHARPGTVSAGADPACLACHDPIGDGFLLAPRFSGIPQPPGGMTAIGCENCHGAGAHHLAVIPAHPNPVPDFTACGQCHTALPPGLAGHAGPRADDILAQYLGSAHAQSVIITSLPFCARCHTDQGFRRLAPQTAGLDGPALAVALREEAPIADPSPIECRTCHEGHSGALRAEPTLAVEAGRELVKYSRQFNLCTACHQVFLAAEFNPVHQAYDYQLDTSAIPFHGELDDQGRPRPGAQVIWDTHFASPGSEIPGYNINAADDQACSVCHDPHRASKFAQQDIALVMAQWTASGHGDYQRPAFTVALDQPECLVCHSATAYADFLAGVPARQLGPDPGGRNVACVACHDLQARNSAGTTVLGPLRPVAEVRFPSGTEVTLTPAANLCLGCHQGLEATGTVEARLTAGELAFVSPHFQPAGAVLLGGETRGGYEYPGRLYRGRNEFLAHVVLGVGELANCVGCHQQTGSGHALQVELTACATCHPGSDFSNLDGSPGHNFAELALLREQLRNLLQEGGVEVLAEAPYFANLTSPAQVRAAYNLHLVENDRGGYIHNGIYLQQLLHDAIADLGGTPLAGRRR